MENTRKHLKATSIIVLALAVLSLINIGYELFFGELNGELQNAVIPEGSPDNVLLITKVFVAVLSLIMILPQLYVGFKGIKLANNPDTSIGHIILGIILVVFAFGALLSPLGALVKGEGNALANGSELLSLAVDFAIMLDYVKYAIILRKEV
jgi:amino acid permease